MSSPIRYFAFVTAVTLACCASHRAAVASDALAAGFYAPPQAAQPRVWWHWMNGNVTEHGMRRDLEWMKRVGIGGVQNFDASFEWGVGFDTPTQVAKPLVYLTPEWRDVLRQGVGLADALGLEFTIASSPGWSQTGGPWVKPPQAMKKLVWSETFVQGGVPFRGRLTAPPQATGLFQNIPLRIQLGTRTVEDPQQPVYYSDVATIAYRALEADVPFESLRPTVTSSSGTIDAAKLYDGDLAEAVPLPFGEGQHSWIQFSFAKPQRFQAVTWVVERPRGFDPLLEADPRAWLEVSDDGKTFRKVADLPRGSVFESSALQQTAAFSPAVARIFRVVVERAEPSLFEQGGLTTGTPRVAHQVAELVLHGAPRVNRFEDKAGYSARQIIASDDTPDVKASDAILTEGIVDLTRTMRPDGSLDWTPPPGRWVVQRFGYSLMGRTNHPASRAGTGLEVDKLNRRHVKTYMDDYLGEYRKTLGPQLIGQRGLQYVLTDSYEGGTQNWTEDMLDQFKQRRGYDAFAWLPVLSGRVVKSAAASDRFLWDFRKTIGELLAEAHYAQISESLRERGLGRYAESHEHLRAFIGDGMEVKRTADVPMGAIWAAAPPVLGFSQETYDADLRESASVANIYGQNVVAAESFTAFGPMNPYGFAPQDLKPLADRALAMGVNRFVIHTSVHQSDDKPGPGLGLGPVGQWFTRKETWAEQSKGWIEYLTRSSYLLQQGRFVADVAYVYGEDTNVTSLFHSTSVPIPAGYSFDFVSPGALINELSPKAGVAVTRSGMEYRVLALDASMQRVSLPVLRKLRDLVQGGAVVVGAAPISTPSLADDEAEFRAIVRALWGDAPGERAVGTGKVFSDRSLAEVLRVLRIAPDVSFAESTGAELRFVHRALDEGHLYFVSNGAARPQKVMASFRVNGKKPELWRADTGAITSLSYSMEQGRTVVPLQLEANDAVFVLFRQPTSAPGAVIEAPATSLLTTLEGAWDVSFPPDLGAPAGVRFDRLRSWTDSADAGVKYFSGTATYSKVVRVRREWLSGGRLRIDLGEVKNLAEVLVNGRSLGVLWKAPFVLDITEALNAGDNRIDIKVTNLWRNRMIGDKQPGARPIATATFDPFNADSPLLPSGLLGPVALVSVGAQYANTSAHERHR